MSILKAAAAFIKNDIRSMPVNKQCYPSTEAIQSAGDYVTKSIAFFLRNTFSLPSMVINVVGHKL
jgi:hypothetical protein